MADTNISWTDKVWNPVVGCSRVSAGCENCYAETFANRLEGMGQARYKGLTVVGKHGARWTGEVRQVPVVMSAPLRWRKGRRVFVNSMSDLFHEAVPFEYVAAVFGVMAACPHHTFQVLTKRPERALAFFLWISRQNGDGHGGWPLHVDVAHEFAATFVPGIARSKTIDWPLSNVHLGVSCEDQQRFDERAPLIRQCPAAVHWASLEPLLGPIDARAHLWPSHWRWSSSFKTPEEAVAAGAYAERKPQALVSAHANFIRWIVVGGESGAGRREVSPAWVDDLVQQAKDTGTPVYVKQDSGQKPGKQGRLSDATWARKEFPAIAKPEATS